MNENRDTVSRVHFRWERRGIDEENEEIQEYFFVFNEENADKKSIATAGEKLLCFFYGESSEDNLNQLRYRSFCRRVSTSSIAITPEFEMYLFQTWVEMHTRLW